MHISKLLKCNITQLKKVYKKTFPWLFLLVERSDSREELKQELLNYIASNDSEAAKQLRLMIAYDNKTVHELSTETFLSVQTFSYIWNFLFTELPIGTNTAIYLDFYYLFLRLEQPSILYPTEAMVKRQMRRWETGLDEEVIAVRDRNKDRIIRLLIKRIDKRYSPNSRYIFPIGIEFEEKYKIVEEWWKEARFHLALAIKSPQELNVFLGNTLSEETMKLLAKGRKKGMPFFITPYYLSLLNIEGEGYDDLTIRTYIIYSRDLIETYGDIRAWEKEDIVEAGKPNAAGWMVPGHNIHRRYPEVAILIPDSMGRACGGLCASCQRMYDFQSERLNFDFESLKVKESWDKKLRKLMNYFEEDTQLQDILITGGDAFMSQNKTLRNILDAVYKMALHKKKANESRPDGEKYAELQRVRLGTRLLAYLPSRVNEELITILKVFKEKATAIGIKQFIIQTHFQSPLEVTPEARKAIQAILDAGWTITNQLVFTVAASRKGHTAKLRKTLNSVGVICYYTFSVKGFKENYAMFAPNSRSIQEAKEEKIIGRIPVDKEEELLSIIYNKVNVTKELNQFLKRNHLPFVATDRNVLNLPAIGKSMSFNTIGITEDGKRILKFEHDTGRKHSPILDEIGEVYIVENKSIAAYLSQLEKMGEDVEEYNSIWNYMKGVTEPRFKIYEYPDFKFKVTDRLTNIQLG